MELIKPVTQVILTIGILPNKDPKKYWITQKLRDGKYSSFGGGMNAEDGSKIYVVHQAEKIIYVGHTTQKVGTRITQSQNAKKYRYKWLSKEYPSVELSVFLFPEPKDCDSLKHYGESIEAELVYLVREQSGRWPAAQNEIHFNNAHPKQARIEAEKIYRCLTSKTIKRC